NQTCPRGANREQYELEYKDAIVFQCRHHHDNHRSHERAKGEREAPTKNSVHSCETHGYPFAPLCSGHFFWGRTKEYFAHYPTEDRSNKFSHDECWHVIDSNAREGSRESARKRHRGICKGGRCRKPI